MEWREVIYAGRDQKVQIGKEALSVGWNRYGWIRI